MKKIIDNFVPMGGRHCITNSIKQVLACQGYHLSEAMLFGLASGLSFLYLNQADSPMISGRTRIFEFEQKLAERLHIDIRCRQGKNNSRIFEAAKRMIDENQPVLIYVDMPYLKYLGMSEDSHFGGHAVVLFGYDDAEKNFYVSDRDNHDVSIRVPEGHLAEDFHLVSYEEIERARSSLFRPFPASNKYLTFDFSGIKNNDRDMLDDAVSETCDIMLNPPARLLVLNGIDKFSKEIKKWKKFSAEKLHRSGLTNYFQISADGGTGGGIFRRMYAEFLQEAGQLFHDDRLTDLGEGFLQVSQCWDCLANELWQLSEDGDTERLEPMSKAIAEIYEIEKGLYISLREAAQ